MNLAYSVANDSIEKMFDVQSNDIITFASVRKIIEQDLKANPARAGRTVRYALFGDARVSVPIIWGDGNAQLSKYSLPP